MFYKIEDFSRDFPLKRKSCETWLVIESEAAHIKGEEELLRSRSKNVRGTTNISPSQTSGIFPALPKLELRIYFRVRYYRSGTLVSKPDEGKMWVERGGKWGGRGDRMGNNRLVPRRPAIYSQQRGRKRSGQGHVPPGFDNSWRAANYFRVTGGNCCSPAKKQTPREAARPGFVAPSQRVSGLAWFLLRVRLFRLRRKSETTWNSPQGDGNRNLFVEKNSRKTREDFRRNSQSGFRTFV